MALVAAVRQAEMTKESLDSPESALAHQRFAPGLVVQIVNQVGEVERTIGEQPPAPMIDVTSIEAPAD
jgi:hypothetical protein